LAILTSIASQGDNVVVRQLGNQVIVLVDDPDVAERLVALATDRVIRVGALTFHGPHAGFGIFEAEDPLMAAASQSEASGGDAYALLPIPLPDIRVSPRYPEPFNCFVFLTLRHGARAAWMAHMVEICGRDGLPGYVAAAHLFGGGRYHAIVEVLAGDMDALHELVLEATDVDGVLAAAPHYVFGDRQFGMGVLDS
jgi:hypothetical protein